MVGELVLLLISSLWLMEPLAAAPPMAKPGCNDSCGSVSIPYPFGIGKEHCYHGKWFEITCNESVNSPPKPFLSRFNLEVLTISLDYQNMTANVPVSPICGDSNWTSTDLTGRPFRFSSLNRFAVMGCSNALLTNQSGEILGGCTASCKSNITTRGCYAINCCQTSIPSGLAMYNIISTDTTCTPSFLWYSTRSLIPGNFTMSSTPVLLDWIITSLDNLPRSYQARYCYFESDIDGMLSYFCECPTYYVGNPYIFRGCEVVGVCAGCKERCAANYTRNYNGTIERNYYCYNKKKIVKGRHYRFIWATSTVLNKKEPTLRETHNTLALGRLGGGEARGDSVRLSSRVFVSELERQRKIARKIASEKGSPHMVSDCSGRQNGEPDSESVGVPLFTVWLVIVA